MRKIAEVARKQRLLDFARDAKLLLETLALTLSFDESGIVENAGCFGGEGIENLAVQTGKSGGALRIQIAHAEKIATFGATFRGSAGLGGCAGPDIPGVERNH